MSDTGSDTEEVTEHTALMDGHIAEARPDREIAERIARKRKTKSDSQRSYGVRMPLLFRDGVDDRLATKATAHYLI